MIEADGRFLPQIDSSGRLQTRPTGLRRKNVRAKILANAKDHAEKNWRTTTAVVEMGIPEYDSVRDMDCPTAVAKRFNKFNAKRTQEAFKKSQQDKQVIAARIQMSASAPGLAPMSVNNFEKTKQENTYQLRESESTVTYQLDKTDAENELHIVKCIVIRNKYIERLISLCEEVSEQSALSIRNQVAVQNACDVVRESGVEIVEHVCRWRAKMGQNTPFQHDGRNYLLKMLTDLDFVAASAPVATFLAFSMNRNPFVVAQALEWTPSQADVDDKKVLSLNTQVAGMDLQRVWDAATILVMEEALYTVEATPEELQTNNGSPKARSPKRSPNAQTSEGGFDFEIETSAGGDQSAPPHQARAASPAVPVPSHVVPARKSRLGLMRDDIAKCHEQVALVTRELQELEFELAQISEPDLGTDKPLRSRSKKRQGWIAKQMAVREDLMGRIEKKEVELWKRKEEVARKMQVIEHVREKEAAAQAKRQRRERKRQAGGQQAGGRTQPTESLGGWDTEDVSGSMEAAETVVQQQKPKTKKQARQDRKERIASTKIQSVFRGKQGKVTVRRRAAEAKNAAEKARVDALQTIQCATRQRQARKKADLKKQEEEKLQAVVDIQRIQRGKQGRLLVDTRKDIAIQNKRMFEEERQQEKEAATLHIQCALRQRNARKQVRKQKYVDTVAADEAEATRLADHRLAAEQRMQEESKKVQALQAQRLAAEKQLAIEQKEAAKIKAERIEFESRLAEERRAAEALLAEQERVRELQAKALRISEEQRLAQKEMDNARKEEERKQRESQTRRLQADIMAAAAQSSEVKNAMVEASERKAEGDMDAHIVRRKSLSQLSIEEVCVFLQSINLIMYTAPFLEMCVDGAMLQDVQEDDLLQLGVNMRVHRTKLMRSINEASTHGILIPVTDDQTALEAMMMSTNRVGEAGNLSPKGKKATDRVARKPWEAAQGSASTSSEQEGVTATRKFAVRVGDEYLLAVASRTSENDLQIEAVNSQTMALYTPLVVPSRELESLLKTHCETAAEAAARIEEWRKTKEQVPETISEWLLPRLYVAPPVASDNSSPTKAKPTIGRLLLDHRTGQTTHGVKIDGELCFLTIRKGASGSIFLSGTNALTTEEFSPVFVSDGELLLLLRDKPELLTRWSDGDVSALASFLLPRLTILFGDEGVNRCITVNKTVCQGGMNAGSYYGLVSVETDADGLRFISTDMTGAGARMELVASKQELLDVLPATEKLWKVETKPVKCTAVMHSLIALLTVEANDGGVLELVLTEGGVVDAEAEGEEEEEQKEEEEEEEAPSFEAFGVEAEGGGDNSAAPRMQSTTTTTTFTTTTVSSDGKKVVETSTKSDSTVSKMAFAPTRMQEEVEIASAPVQDKAASSTSLAPAALFLRGKKVSGQFVLLAITRSEDGGLFIEAERATGGAAIAPAVLRGAELRTLVAARGLDGDMSDWLPGLLSITDDKALCIGKCVHRAAVRIGTSSVLISAEVSGDGLVFSGVVSSTDQPVQPLQTGLSELQQLDAKLGRFLQGSTSFGKQDVVAMFQRLLRQLALTQRGNGLAFSWRKDKPASPKRQRVSSTESATKVAKPVVLGPPANQPLALRCGVKLSGEFVMLSCEKTSGGALLIHGMHVSSSETLNSCTVERSELQLLLSANITADGAALLKEWDSTAEVTMALFKAFVQTHVALKGVGAEPRRLALRTVIHKTSISRTGGSARAEFLAVETRPDGLCFRSLGVDPASDGEHDLVISRAKIEALDPLSSGLWAGGADVGAICERLCRRLAWSASGDLVLA
jgi:hypothetical protein